MAEFYVELNACDTGERFLHRAECTALPAKDTLRYLGAISNPTSAAKKASEFLKMVTPCPHCLPAAATAQAA